MNIVIATYLAYVLVSVSLTFWVGRNLHKNGRFFIIDAFHGDTKSADAVNHLLLVGFYLVNFGFVALFLSYGNHPSSLVGAIEYISTKLGVVLVVLGGMHFFNMRNIANMRSKAQAKKGEDLPAAG
jgi:hypothetical protein